MVSLLELGLVIFLILLIFGAGKMPQEGSALSKTVREFCNAKSGDEPKNNGDAFSSKTKDEK